MIDKAEIIKDLKHNLSKSRYEHSVSVSKKAMEIGSRYGLDNEKLEIAGILHDCAKGQEEKYEKKYSKEFKELLKDKKNSQYTNPFLKHCLLGMIVAREKYKVKDENILNSIKEHTTGSLNMSKLSKVIYLADKTEDYRDYDGVDDIRKLSLIDMDKAIVLSLNNTINYLIENDRQIAPESIELRNFLLGGIGERN
ncbi:MAG: bis(5'-nucleosyl)-tetraphosphatase (symmetrical) YqeK [Lagierella massiliensis]|nr:bis(5'-nucleosyl)-tetraphosphatase (symmetrical) YqeK [Lagierella massiliensis]